MSRNDPTSDRDHPPEAAAAEATAPTPPSTGSVQPPEPAAWTPGPWGVRRWRVTQPPAARRTASASTAPVGVFPSREPAAASTPAASTSADSHPVTTELLSIPLFANVPQKPYPPMTPPPTAWRTVSTVSLLRSILPPIEPLHAPTPPEPLVAGEVRAAMLAAEVPPVTGAPVPASPFAAATAVADIRARLPGSTPLAGPPTAAVAVGPWPAEARARTESGSAQGSFVQQRSLRRRALLMLLRLAVAAAATVLLYLAASGLLDRRPGASVLPATVAMSSVAAVDVGATALHVERPGRIVGVG